MTPATDDETELVRARRDRWLRANATHPLVQRIEHDLAHAQTPAEIDAIHRRIDGFMDEGLPEDPA